MTLQRTDTSKDVDEIQEACCCGRRGKFEDRQPVITGDGKQARKYARCGHVDRLDWLSEDARRATLVRAERRRRTAA